MTLRLIVPDRCFIDPRGGRLTRFEALDCGHPGRPLGRLRPRAHRNRTPGLKTPPDVLEWMYHWPEGPTHGVIAQPTLRKPPATRRQCCSDDAPITSPLALTFHATLEPDELVLHHHGSTCEACGT